jgi:5-methylcytosine-specific restriction endonuclease McrA
MGDDRASARARGYTTRWDKASTAFKRRHPWCLGCAALGKQTPAVVVDHVEPHKGNQTKFWTTSLWQPSCDWHHRSIKSMLEGMYARGELKVADLWLNSSTAIGMSKRYPKQQAIGEDGWPAG